VRWKKKKGGKTKNESGYSSDTTMIECTPEEKLPGATGNQHSTANKFAQFLSEAQKSNLGKKGKGTRAPRSTQKTKKAQSKLDFTETGLLSPKRDGKDND
jgi:hypothetical protein